MRRSAATRAAMIPFDSQRSSDKVFGSGWGGIPQRSQRAQRAEVYWEGGKGTYIGAVFNNCLGQLNRYH